MRAVAAAAGATALACSGVALGQMTTLALRVGGSNLVAEVASTPAEQAKGLMGRTSLAVDGGMLFPLPVDYRVCLWMKDTPLQLSAAFVDADGLVLNVVDLVPFDPTLKCAAVPARFALEVRAGWFAEHGVKPGDRIEGLPPGAKARGL